MSELDGKQCQACGERNTEWYEHERPTEYGVVYSDRWECKGCGYDFGREDVDE